jgi:hypothetical protein
MQAIGVQAREQQTAQANRDGLALGRRAAAARGGSRGLVWPLLERLGVLCGARPAAKLEVLETISLGGRRQLFLIACGGERYLVGVGAENVGSMLRVGSNAAADTVARQESV